MLHFADLLFKVIDLIVCDGINGLSVMLCQLNRQELISGTAGVE